MSVTESDRVKVCNEWYSAFDQRQLDRLMALFTADPLVVVGAGGSRRTVPYAGVYEGQANVRWYYRMRFEQETQQEKASNQPRGKFRPDCGIVRPPCEFGVWVVFGGDIKDEPDLSPYQGPFLHVFRFDAHVLKIASLEMFLVP